MTNRKEGREADIGNQRYAKRPDGRQEGCRVAGLDGWRLIGSKMLS